MFVSIMDDAAGLAAARFEMARKKFTRQSTLDYHEKTERESAVKCGCEGEGAVVVDVNAL